MRRWDINFMSTTIYNAIDEALAAESAILNMHQKNTEADRSSVLRAIRDAMRKDTSEKVRQLAERNLEAPIDDATQAEVGKALRQITHRAVLVHVYGEDGAARILADEVRLTATLEEHDRGMAPELKGQETDLLRRLIDEGH